MKTHFCFAPAILVATFCAHAPAQSARSPLPEDRATGARAIDTEALREWLVHLTSNELAGRGTGSAGFAKAADYVRGHFEELGLEPGNGEDWLQPVDWTRRAPDPQLTALTLTGDGETRFRLSIEDGLHGDVTVDAESVGRPAIVVCRGDETDEIAALGLEGRAVVLVAQEGVLGEIEPQQRPYAPFLALRAIHRLATAVQRAGGSLVAVADDVAYELIGAPREATSPGRASAGRAGAGRNRRPSQFVITLEHASRLAAAAGLTERYATATPLTPLLAADSLELSARMKVNVEDAPAANVLAVLPGTDPELKDEFVAIGCHLDHLGVRGGAIHPGADDDGSGTVGLMAIASAFAANPAKPRRSVLFMAFCGEENGLIGSAHFARNPTVPLESIVAELQIDMIGRREETTTEAADDNANTLHLIGTEKLSADLHALCLRLNEQRAGFELEWDEEDVFGRSDHFNFAREGVPIAFFFTGFHPDYHKPTDTVDKIDFEKLARIATLVYDLAFELAVQDERPLVDPERWAKVPNRARSEPAAPMRTN